MEVIALSSKSYKEKEKNYGDCFIINTNTEVFVYDCGSKEHAERVIEYLDNNNIQKVKLILSHNDKDHFEGIITLLENKRVSCIYTVLLLKYKDELLNRIGDGRKNRDSISQHILDLYSNIAKLGEYNVELIDIYKENSEEIIDPINNTIKIVGPGKDYMLDVASKALDSREGNTIDNESVINATSVQVSINNGNTKILLTGDSCFEALKENLKEHNCIQLPHHGKCDQAEEIFKEKEDSIINTVYIISDNTGNSNGGSDSLNVRGKNVKNTKSYGDIKDIANIDMYIPKAKTTLGIK